MIAHGTTIYKIYNDEIINNYHDHDYRSRNKRPKHEI